MLNKIKNQLIELSKLEEITNKAEKAMMEDPMNEAKERLFDKHYKREFDCYIKTSEMITVFTSGKIDMNTAKKLIMTKRSELINTLC